jgi:hypothetical protein
MIAVGAVALAGCAADPDLTELEANLAEIPGVTAAEATVSHPGLPWNTEILVSLFVEDSSDETVIGAFRGAASVFLADPATSRHPVSVGLLEGEPADYPSSVNRSSARIPLNAVTAEELGLEVGGGFIALSSEDLQRLADES